MSEVVGVKLEVDASGADKPVKSIRAELKEATADLIKMQEKFGELSPQAIAAAKAVAGLRDQIQEANEVAQLFDPGKTFQSVIGVGQAIAGGFAAAQGAMALFGVESEEVEQALLKVNAAMALAQGLSTVKDSLKDFQRLGAVLGQITIVQRANAAANALAAGTMRLFGVATVQTGVAFNVLKGAIIATGIGALIIVVGTLIQKIVEWATAADEAAEAQKRLDQAAVDSAKEFTQKLLDANRQAEVLAVARAKADGKSADEIQALQKRAAEDRIQTLQDALGQMEKDEKAWSETNRALMKERDAKDIKDYERKAAVREEAEKKAKEQQDKAAAKRKQDEEKVRADRKAALEAAIQVEQQIRDQLFALQHSAEENELYQLGQTVAKRLEIERKAGRDTADVLVEWALQRGAIEKKYADERVAALQAENQKKDELRKSDLAATLASLDEQKAKEDEYGEDRKRYNEALLVHRRGITTATAQLAEIASDIAGQQTAEGKALAIIAATISTYQAAQQAYLSAFLPLPTIASPALGFLSAGAAVAFGLNNIRKIAGIQIGGGRSGGSGVPSISATAPLSPQAALAQPVQLNQSSINGMGDAMNGKVYVLESDMTEKQRRVDNLQRASIFG